MAAVHGFKALFKFRVMIAVRYYWGRVKARLYHGYHLVPGFKHLPAVNALNVQSLEYNVVPVYYGARAGYAKQGHLAAVAHGLEQLIADVELQKKYYEQAIVMTKKLSFHHNLQA